MSTISDLFTGQRRPAVYKLESPLAPQAIVQEAAARGWRCFYLDGSTIDDKASFLAACADAMQFPAYFGRNWDALDDCLNDLSWAPASGYIVLYDEVARFSRGQPGEWASARAVLVDAVSHWTVTGTPMYVLLRGTRGSEPALPRF